MTSLVLSAKEGGYWHTLAKNVQETLEQIDGEIRKRFHLLVLIDVATRMVLAWIISEQPSAEATLALLRMATRDKSREKIIYGCEGETAPAMGLGMIKNDNGTGLRNATVKEATLGLGTASTDVRTSSPTDKAVIERLFGTTESMLMKVVHGYTGRKPGDLPGYDSVKNGVLTVEDLMKVITPFFIDKYPSTPHWGVGMAGRRPVEVMKELNETRGIFKCIDEDRRRVHLGFKEVVTPNDEGVRVFKTLWYSSLELNEALNEWPKGGKKLKVSVFIDPDELKYATVIVPGKEKLFRVPLQTTFFADMTLVEVANLWEAYRSENLAVTEIHEDRLLRYYEKNREFLHRTAVEHGLARSYSTQEELRQKLKTVTAGAQMIPTARQPMTVAPENILVEGQHEGVFPIGGDDSHETSPVRNQDKSYSSNPPAADVSAVPDCDMELEQMRLRETPTVEEAEQQAVKDLHRPLGRPKLVGKFT